MLAGVPVWNRLIFSLGAEIDARDVETTTPNQAVASATSTSLLTELSLPGIIQDGLHYEAILAVGFPFSHRETAETTGSYASGLLIEPALSFGYRLREFFEIGVGISARLQSFRFTGSGTRGTIDSTESMWTFSAPVEFRFWF